MTKLIKIFSIIILPFIIILTLTCIFTEPYTTEKKVKKEFLNHNNIIINIAEYLLNSEYTNITIQNTDYIYEGEFYGCWHICSEDSEFGKTNVITTKIEDADLINLVDFLFKDSKYQIIKKTENTIYFQLWANLDSSRGMAFSMDGQTPKIQLLTRIESLSQKNWYYYETDINKWKLNNQSQRETT